MANPKKTIEEILAPRNDGIEVTPERIRKVAKEKGFYNDPKKAADKEKQLTGEIVATMPENVQDKPQEQPSISSDMPADSTASDTATATKVEPADEKIVLTVGDIHTGPVSKAQETTDKEDSNKEIKNKDDDDELSM